jgi:hypothetical protein
MISPEKREANRINSRKSTGPKSVEGKARSARNAVTHGLTSQPGEPTEAYREALAEWVGDLKPKGIVERTLAERACRAAWNLRRCDRHEDATSAKRNRDAAESYDLTEAARVEAVGWRLITLPVAGETDEVDPAALVAELRRTEAGVSWLLARWSELGRALKEPGGWGEAHRFMAVRLLGLRLESAGDHPAIGRIMPRSIEPSGGGSWFDNPALKGSLEAAVKAGEQGLGDPKELWLDCVRAVVGRGRVDAESGTADAKRLGALVRSERSKLARLMRRVLKERAAEDRAGAADRAMFDESKSLSLCIRYATAASRDLHRSISDLAKLREAGEDEGRDDGSEPPPSSGPGAGEDSPSCVGAKLRNEATDTPPRPGEDTDNRGVLEPLIADDPRLQPAIHHGGHGCTLTARGLLQNPHFLSRARLGSPPRDFEIVGRMAFSRLVDVRRRNRDPSEASRLRLEPRRFGKKSRLRYDCCIVHRENVRAKPRMTEFVARHHGLIDSRCVNPLFSRTYLNGG